MKMTANALLIFLVTYFVPFLGKRGIIPRGDLAGKLLYTSMSRE